MDIPKTSAPDDTTKKLTLTQKALKNLADRVSVAGLKEALQEEIIWIRCIFKIALVIFFGCILYFTSRDVVMVALKRPITTNINEIADLEDLPMPNVTICIEYCTNGSFVHDDVTILEDLVKKVEAEIGDNKDQFLQKFARYLAPSCYPRPGGIQPSLAKYMRKIYQSNPQIFDYAKYRRLILPSCSKIFKSCLFRGRPIDCCENARELVAENGICYQLGIGLDANDLVQYDATLRQKDLGPASGLKIEAEVDFKDDVMLEEEFDMLRDNGFQIFASPSPAAVLLSPVTAPDKSETFIKVTASECVLGEGTCIPSHKNVPSVMEGGYYDPYGHTCVVDNIVQYLYELTSCYSVLAHYRFNGSMICAPEIAHIIMASVSAHDIEETSGLGFASSTKKVDEMFKGIQARFNAVAQLRKTKCRPLCRFWDYTSSASYNDLIHLDPNPKDRTTMYSLIHIYFGELSYRRSEEVEAVPPYLAFYNFGNIVGLYLGMSVVTFAQLLYYLFAYIHAVRRRHIAIAPSDPAVVPSGHAKSVTTKV